MNKKVYFPGLNGVRFLAALSVIFFHIELLKREFYIVGSFRSPFILQNFVLDGDDAVTLFFVLSGFLITYLLLIENQQTGTIAVKDFYVRRILRIWPLYYLLILIGFVVLPLIAAAFNYRLFNDIYANPPSTVVSVFGQYVFFFPTIRHAMGLGVPGIAQLWSIGVEELFYLFWPLLFLRFSRKLPYVLLGIIIVKFSLNFLYFRIPEGSLLLKFLLGFLGHLRFENMAVGGLGAYVLFTNQERLLKIIFHPITEIIVLAVMAGNIFLFDANNYKINALMSVIYVVFLINIAQNPRSKIKLEHPILDMLGRISYGIYMYHTPILYVVMLTFHRLGFEDNSIFYNIILYSLVTTLTIFIAHISYTKFETPFLKLKQRFTVIASGGTAIENQEIPTPSSIGK